MRLRLPWSTRARGVAVPPEVLAGLGLAPEERVLAAAPLPAGEWVVATDRSLRVAGEELAWTSIVHAAWEREDDVLVIETVAGDGVAAGRRRLLLDAPGDVPVVVRERVMASIVVSQRVPLRGEAGVRVVARRVPGSEAVFWQVVLDEGLDPRDATLRPAIEAALETVQAGSSL